MIRGTLILTLILMLRGVSNGAGQVSPRAGAPQGGVVDGIRGIIYTVADLDRAISFYQRAFGFKLRGTVPAPVTNREINILSDTAGARFRSAELEIPGASFGLELREFSGISRHKGAHRVQDPGNVLLNIDVTGVDRVLANAVRAGATVVTTGNEVIRRTDPVAGRANRSVYIRDLDGFTWHLEQFEPETRRPRSPDQLVLGADSIRITLSSVDVAPFWQPLGVTVQAAVLQQFDSGDPAAKLMAVEGSTRRSADVVIDGTDRRWQIFEFTGIPRTPYLGRPQDPGTPMLALQVSDVPAVVRAAPVARARVVTRGGVPVRLDDGRSAIVLRDTDGFLIQFEEHRP